MRPITVKFRISIINQIVTVMKNNFTDIQILNSRWRTTAKSLYRPISVTYHQISMNFCTVKLIRTMTKIPCSNFRTFKFQVGCMATKHVVRSVDKQRAQCKRYNLSLFIVRAGKT